jgi:P-type Cu+ transporter
VVASSLAHTETRSEQDVWLSVRGMTCGSCAARLETRLNALDGVEATVNFATERAWVRSSVPTAALLREVQTAGFTAQAVARELRGGGDVREDANRRVKSLGRRLVVAGLLFMPLCDASIGFAVVPSVRFPGWQWLLLFMALPVVTWCAWPFYVAAVRQARHRLTTMDTLASMGILAAICWSVYAMFFLDTKNGADSLSDVLVHHSGGALYLDVAAGVTTFLLAGRYVEARSRRRATDALSTLAAVGAKEVSILDVHGVERLRPVGDLTVGDRFLVRPGETVATDGTVEMGQSVLDRSSMTGESTPTEVGPGDQVVGGTVAMGGRLVVRAESVGADTQLSQMLDLVEHAQNEKAAAQRLADRIAGYFVPVAMAIALATLAGWLVAGAAGDQALNAALSVLIIACPCALGLATPMALVVASDRGARSGIFFKGYEAVESSGTVDTVLFDKTGTITDGRMSVVDVAAVAPFSVHDVIRRAASIERASEHPVGRAIVASTPGEVELEEVEDFRAIAGMGAQGTLEGHVIWVRSLRKVDTEIAQTIPAALQSRCERWLDDARTVVEVCEDGRVIGAIAVTDTVRPSAPRAVALLQRLGLHCVLVTGDNEQAANVVARQCGLDGVLAGVSPQDKVSAVARLQREGHRVAMVGDGINDGPALAQADLGLALGSGTDVARNSADLLVIRDDLGAVPTAITLARRTHLTIRRNLMWAFGYNLVAIPLAACGFLDPLIAAAAMALSSGFVVWNSARLRHVPDATSRDCDGAVQ